MPSRVRATAQAPRVAAPSTPALVASVASFSNAARYSGRQSGIPRVVERVDPKRYRPGVKHLGPAHGEREENRVPGRDVGRRDVCLVELTVLWDRAGADQGGPAKCRKVDVEFDMPGHAKIAGNVARRLDLARMYLAVSNRERVQLVSLGPHHRARGIGVEPAAEQTEPLFEASFTSNALRPGATPTCTSASRVARGTWHVARGTSHVARHTPLTSAPQMYLWACSCSRTTRRSARIHSARSFAASAPCTGENSTAAVRADEVVPGDDVARVFVVGAIANDELHFVVRRQEPEVLPVIAGRLAATRTLDVDDADDLRAAPSRCSGARRSRPSPSGRRREGAASAGRRPSAAGARRP